MEIQILSHLPEKKNKTTKFDFLEKKITKDDGIQLDTLPNHSLPSPPALYHLNADSFTRYNSDSVLASGRTMVVTG